MNEKNFGERKNGEPGGRVMGRKINRYNYCNF